MAKFKTKYQEIWWQLIDWNFFKNIFSILWRSGKSTNLNEFCPNFKLLILEIFVAENSNKHFCKLDKILRNFPSWHVFVSVTVFKKFRFEICNFKHLSFNEKATRCDQGYRKCYFDNILAKNTVILFLFSKINNCKTFVLNKWWMWVKLIKFNWRRILRNLRSLKCQRSWNFVNPLRTMPRLNGIFTECQDCCDVIINMIVAFSKCSFLKYRNSTA